MCASVCLTVIPSFSDITDVSAIGIVSRPAEFSLLIHIYIYIYICNYVYIYMYVYLCMCMYMYVYVLVKHKNAIVITNT